MSDISTTSWSEIDNSNTQQPPEGWPAGMFPNAVEPSARMNMGAMKRFWNRINPVYAATLSTTDSFVMTPTQSFVGYGLYERVRARFSTSNTTTSPTINISALGGILLKKYAAGSATNLALGDIQNQDHEFWWDGSQMILTNPYVAPTVIPVIPTAPTMRRQIFATSGTFVASASVPHEILVIGGGGGGGGNSANGGASGGGGGAGGTAIASQTLTSSTGYTVTIGAAGTAGASGGASAGGNGGNSSFVGTATLTGNGGTGGGGGNGTNAVGAGGAGGTATNGDVNITGGAGVTPCPPGTLPAIGGSGGASFMGPGGAGGTSVPSPVAGQFGSGGGGSGYNGGALAGAAGANGFVIIRWVANS